LIICLFFGIGLLVKKGIISYELLANSKDFVAVVKDVTTILVILLGSVLSYFRFFMGRVFSAKGDVECEVIKIETPHQTIMHCLKFALINKGTLTITEPIGQVVIKEHLQNGEVKVSKVSGLREIAYKEYGLIDIVDVGEKAFFQTLNEFDNSTWAIEYLIEVKGSTGAVWKNCIIVDNKVKIRGANDQLAIGI